MSGEEQMNNLYKKENLIVCFLKYLFNKERYDDFLVLFKIKFLYKFHRLNNSELDSIITK